MGMDGTRRYWLEKLLYAGWIYISLMLFLSGGLSSFWHLIPLALGLCMLQNYLVEQDQKGDITMNREGIIIIICISIVVLFYLFRVDSTPAKEVGLVKNPTVQTTDDVR